MNVRTNPLAPAKAVARDDEAAPIMVVLEPASPWPADFLQGSPVSVVAEQPGESRVQLGGRVQAMIRTIERQGRPVGTVILSCNGAASRDAIRVRTCLAHSLLRAVLRSDEGRLILLANASVPAATRQALFALAGALTSVLPGSTASVSVRFT
jgi:hypothetical protein